MSKFRKKPVVIEAVQLGGERDITPGWWSDAINSRKIVIHNPGIVDSYALINTLEGVMRAERGDWIIKGVKGELYPCKPDIFAATYDAVVSYQLKGGEYVKGGKLYGWTGKECTACRGTGEGGAGDCPCGECGGTGDEHGVMPVQPSDLPPDTE